MAATKSTRTSKSATSKTATKKALKSVGFVFAITGQEPSNRKAVVGTTYKDLINHFSLQGVKVMVNGSASFNQDAQVQEGDNITAVTAVKAGC